MAAAGPLIIMAVSAVVSASAKNAEGQDRARQYESQAAAQRYNAAVERQRAETVTSVYGEREEAQRRRARLILGKERAAIAQSGAGLGGSNADIERQSEVMAELDALNIRYEGQLESHGLLAQATLDEFEAASLHKSAKSAARAGRLGAAGALLGGAGQMFGAYSSGGRAG